MSFGAVFNFVSELYPTHLRGTGIGVGSSFARIGGFLAPQVLKLGGLNPLLPSFFIGVISFVGAVVRYWPIRAYFARDLKFFKPFYAGNK